MTLQQQIRDQLHAAVRRVDQLRARAATDPAPAFHETLEELLTALEELRVSEEEMRRQTEAVAAAQARVEEEHHRYLALFHFAPDPYLVTDLDGVVREANRAAGEMLGVRESRLAGKPLAVFVAPAQARAFRTTLAHLADTGRVDDWELRLHPRHRPAVEFSCTVAVARGRDGRPEGLRWMLRDVTGRRAAETRTRALEAEAAGRAQAQAAEERVRGILESIGDAFVAIGRDWRFTYLNRRAEELVQRVAGSGAALGRGVWELFPGAADSVWERELRRAMDGGAAVSFEGYSWPLATWFEVRAYPAPEGLSVYFTDVTERRRRREADRLLGRVSELLAAPLDSEARLQQLADLVAGGLADYCIVHVEEDGQVRAPGVAHADPTRRELLRGVLRRFPVNPAGPHPSMVALRTGEPQLLPQVPHSLLEEMATGPEHLEMMEALGMASAMVVPMEAGGRRVGALSLGRARGGEPYGARDLALVRELARRAGLAVENARLYEQARQATRAREEVLAVVSHDLRNPLNAVLLAAVILDEYSDAARWTERERRQISTIRHAAQQMTALIGDLVEVVALESGQRVLHPEPVEPERLLADAVELHRGLAAQKGVALQAEPAPGLPGVRADRARCLQVLANLLGNAIKFTPGGGTVTVGAAPRSDGVGFFVSDTGPGIAPEQVARVFDRFWQAERGRGEGAGLGLGLAIARGIVEAHGGRIWAESAPGRGSTFFFTLPLNGGAER